jgi:hypothetical protein
MPGSGFRTSVSNKGVATLLPGAPGSQGAVTTDSFIYEAAQVEDIITNESDSELNSTLSSTANVGRAKIRFMNTSRGTNTNELPWADPLTPYQTSYPLVGEYVLVFKMLGTYYYVGPINTKRQITDNAAPLVGIAASQPTSNLLKNQRKTALGVLTQPVVDINRVGKNFKKQKVYPVKSFEGDVIYQGRYGQSIRLGSSQMVSSAGGEQYPNIILRAGQGPATALTTDDRGPASLTNESLNTDLSSIYMVSNQILPLVPSTYGTNIHLRSLLQKPIAFDGASILLNSDRLIFNSKATSIFMFSKKGIHLNSLEDGFSVDTGGPILLTTPNTTSIFSEKTIDITSKEDATFTARRDINVSGDRNITIYGNEIFLGGRSSTASPIAMAKPLKLFMLELLRTLMSTQPLVIGPTGVVNPALIARLLVVYAKYMVFPDPFNPLWASNDNFVMKSNEQTLSGPTYLPKNQSFKNVSGLGTRGASDAARFGREEADNAGLKGLRKLYDDELASKL